MNRDYRNTAYCKQLENVIEKKEKLEKMIKENHPRVKIIYNQVKSNEKKYKKIFMDIYNYKCSYCGNSIDNISSSLFEVDHYICETSFTSKEEAGEISNLVLSCYDCNRSKRELLIQDSYKEVLNTDNGNIAKVFERDDDYYIKISNNYKNDEFVKSFYEKLKLSYESRRLDYLLMNIKGLCKKNSNREEIDKLYKVIDKLQQKRNIMRL